MFVFYRTSLIVSAVLSAGVWRWPLLMTLKFTFLTSLFFFTVHKPSDILSKYFLAFGAASSMWPGGTPRTSTILFIWSTCSQTHTQSSLMSKTVPQVLRWWVATRCCWLYLIDWWSAVMCDLNIDRCGSLTPPSSDFERGAALTSLEPLKRGSPVCISTRMHPRDHMSMARSYGIPRRTSGER